MGENGEMMTPQAHDGMRTVLIVEDSAWSATLIEMVLQGMPGVSVRLARSGLEALGIIDQPNADVGLIITDLNMPRMDGFELIQRIRNDRRTSGMPIIVISADTDPQTPERIARLNVDAFFSKPFSPAQVRRKLEQILNGKTD